MAPANRLVERHRFSRYVDWLGRTLFLSNLDTPRIIGTFSPSNEHQKEKEHLPPTKSISLPCRQANPSVTTPDAIYHHHYFSPSRLLLLFLSSKLPPALWSSLPSISGAARGTSRLGRLDQLLPALLHPLAALQRARQGPPQKGDVNGVWHG